MSWIRNNVSKQVSHRKAWQSNIKDPINNLQNKYHKEQSNQSNLTLNNHQIPIEYIDNSTDTININKIDAILYINLEHRKDRLEHIVNEIKKIDPTLSKTHRIDAIYDKQNGALGCSLSHIKALQYFIEHPEWNTCIILEDDFSFTYNDGKKINKIINFVQNNVPDYDVILLGVGIDDLKYTDTDIPIIKKVESSQTTSAYIFTRKYVYTLLANYVNGSNDMKLNGKLPHNYLDEYWKRLMPFANWYAILPRIGYQYDNYSDIENKVTNYKC